VDVNPPSVVIRIEGLESAELIGIVTLAVMVVVLTTTTLSIVAEAVLAIISTTGSINPDPRMVMSTLVPTTPDGGLMLVMTGLCRTTVKFTLLLIPAVVLTLTE
jgi:hypothetical protein